MRITLFISLLVLIACSEEEIKVVDLPEFTITQDSVASPDPVIPIDSTFKTIDVASDVWGLRFELLVPKDWEHRSNGGLDSWVGIIGNDTDSLLFDYGWYGNSIFRKSDKCEILFEKINGLDTKICIPRDGVYNAMVVNRINVRLFDEPDRSTTFTFTMGQRNDNFISRTTALTIFRSFKPTCYDSTTAYLCN